MKESPIFSKTYQLLAWLIPLTVKFPRQQRFVLAAALQQDALNLQSRLIEAVHSHQPADRLRAADTELDKLRTHLRLSRDLQLVTFNQYEHAARLLTEIGKLLGGWNKAVAARQ